MASSSLWGPTPSWSNWWVRSRALECLGKHGGTRQGSERDAILQRLLAAMRDPELTLPAAAALPLRGMAWPPLSPGLCPGPRSLFRAWRRWPVLQGPAAAPVPGGQRSRTRGSFGILRARGALEGWEVVQLHGLTHHEVAERFRAADVRVSSPAIAHR